MRIDRRALLRGVGGTLGAAAIWNRARAASRNDIAAFAEPTLVPLLAGIGTTFRERTGTAVHLFSAPSVMLIREIPFTLCDIAILEQRALTAAASAGNVTSANGPHVPLGVNGLVVARRGHGAAVPIDTLTPRGTVAVVDAAVPDALGAFSRDCMQRAGWPPAGTKMQGVARDADALDMLKHGPAEFAVLYRTDVAADDSISAAAMLPNPSMPIGYTAVLSAKPSSDRAADFLEYLTMPETVLRLRSGGLEMQA